MKKTVSVYSKKEVGKSLFLDNGLYTVIFTGSFEQLEYFFS